MKRGKYEKVPPAAPRKKLLTLVLCLVLLAVLGIGGTLALLSSSANPVINTFVAGSVSADVVETLNGTKTTKTSIQVENTGESPVYVRVRIVDYWMEDGEILPKASQMNVTPASGWKKMGQYYYYMTPLSADEGQNLTTNLLAAPLEMGVGQVIDVLAETVQATPADAVLEVWGVSAAQITG